MSAITLVTHAALPLGSRDDHLLAAALYRQGAQVRFAVWDDPAVDWAATPITVVRSTWDYHLKPTAWRMWLDYVSLRTQLLNPVPALHWNSEKSYLLDLAARDIPIVPTLLLDHNSASPLAGCRERGWTDIVVKPAIGASAHGARRFAGAAGVEQACAYAAQLLEHGRVLLQPYEPAVERQRERSLVLVEGAFSHAFTKPAFMTGAGQASGLQRHVADDAEIDFARQVLAGAEGNPLFARVDLLPCNDGLRLMELELIEPQLAFHLEPAATGLFAWALLSA